VAERIANIGAIGIGRRRLGGIVWLVIALGALAVMMATHRAHWYRLLLFVPFALAAMGLLQAREKT
jgi:hypothetical protein